MSMDKGSVLELRRQMLHAVFGLSVAVIIWLMPRLEAGLIISGGMIIGVLLSWYYIRTRQGFLHRVLLLFERKRDLEAFPGKGPIMMLAGALAVTVLMPKMIALPAVLVVALSDAAATAFGILIGRHRYRHNPRKSLEGSLAFFVIACAITYAFASALITMFVCFVVTVAESTDIGFRKHATLDDNLVVPLLYGALLLLMTL